MSKVSIQISMDHNDELFIDLPGPEGRLRSVPIKETAHISMSELILRVLKGLQMDERGIGLAGAPTERQMLHWNKHVLFPDPRCPFCKAEKALGEMNEKRLKSGLRRLVRKCDGVDVRHIPPERLSDETRRTAEELGL